MVVRFIDSAECQHTGISRFGKNFPAILAGYKSGERPKNFNEQLQFYEDYRKETEEYDKEFMKKYEEDLNTALIFVGCARCSGAHALT